MCRRCVMYSYNRRVVYSYDRRVVADQWRGHEMVLVGGVWLYADTRRPVRENPDRACGHCGGPNRADDHDACLGRLPEVMNACCGHGEEAMAYIQFPNGR